LLAQLLARQSAMAVANAVDGEAIRRGHVYVAPPDHHLTIDAEHVRVTRGPLQNRHRPSIDVLFRSAAMAHCERVIGVVLTGSLNDGSAGLKAIKDLGGTCVVQDPRSAEYPSMPKSALRTVEVDHCVALDQMAELLVRLSTDAHVHKSPDLQQVEVHRIETDADLGNVHELEKIAKPSSFVCPDCGGGLWELRGKEARYRCRVGHGYSVDDLVASQDAQVERALWAAARSLEDRAALSRSLAEQWRGRDADELVERFLKRSQESTQHASTLRDLLRVPKPSAAT
jgi:two-component system chemotaxis response regulator CheB